MKLSAALLAVAAAAALPAAAQPVEHFFRQPQYANVVIAPDGERVAALSPVEGRQNVVVIDLKDMKPTVVTSFASRDIVEVRWINDKRLLARTGSLREQAFQARGGALYAVDADGRNGRMVAEGGEGEQMAAGVRYAVRPMELVGIPAGGSDDVIAQEFVVDSRGARADGLYRVNTRSGAKTVLSLGKPDSGEAESWVVDANGVPRAFTAIDKGVVRIWYRASETAEWRKLDEYPEGKGPGWAPLAVDEDPRFLIVTGRPGADRAAIMRYDVEARKFTEALAEHPQVDLRRLVFSEGKPVGVFYNADRVGHAWFDPDIGRVQRAIDAAMPDRVNILSASRDRTRFVVTSFSDTVPGSFYLFDVKARKLTWLLDRRPWIKPDELSPMRAVRYAARDGLEIPAYLTLPRGKPGKNLPLVLVIHGGPWVDGDTWQYHPEVQFLASRGYAVLQPNFRGTTRYGWKHLSASFGQWGLTMQDDIADGVAWAVAQGIADPKRVCIYGGSYGGYATMMGLARHPELYRCGINYVGVTDLELFLNATWSDYAESELAQHSLKSRVGELPKDAKRLRETSPVELGGRIKAPVMMAYGGVDFRVPIEHGTRMKAALERNGHTPVWMVAEGEGHGFRDPKNWKMFYEAMEKFLSEHLGS